ncbi:MAG: inositol 2-dehydrogenase [Acidimicrobiales bacterium]|nr:inositol 2-dehydrogenase [Acidimicrobiales bacterium]RZV48218.1 MAG: inositol 2-dehydrogenase [Acidimicrobiales bacterium]
MTTPTIAVLGTGRIGKMHAELIARQVPGLDLDAVYDVFTEGAQAVADELGCRRAESIEEVMASDVDAVAICSSTDTHVDLVVAAAEAGKAIFLEKPVSLNLEEVDRAVAAVKSTGVPIQIGFNRRFDAAHAAVKQAVADGSVGDVHMVRITSRDPAPPPIEYINVSGGIFCDMTIHDFDMARFVTGSEVVEVYARGAVRVDPAIGEAGDVDTAVVMMTHENGAITTIDNSRQAVYGYDQRVEVFGSGGMAVSENPREHTTEIHTADGTRQQNIPYFFLERYIPSYLAEWSGFLDGLASGTMPVTIEDGRAPLVIGLAAWKSVREDRPVKISEIG